MDSKPTANVSVALTKTGSSDVTFTPAGPLTFTTSNYNTYQTVTVSAADDADGITEAVTTLSLTATGGNFNDVRGDIAVNVTENDTRGITIDKSSLSLNEGGQDTFTVKLDTQPSASTTVNYSLPANTRVTLNPTRLTFTTSNWQTAQTVTVTSIQDDDANDISETISISATGSDYASETKQIALTVDDDETIALILSSTTFSALTEGGDGQSFTVKLGSQPSGDVTVAVDSSNADVKIGTSTATTNLTSLNLTFTTSRWDTVQTVTFKGIEDDDAIDDTSTIRLAASGGGYSTASNLSVTVDDNDTADLVGIPTSLELEEGGDAKTFTVKLMSEPSANVTVTVASSDSDVTIDTDSAMAGNQNTLTFTTTTWETAQTVTLKAIADDDTVDATPTITATAAGGDYAGKSKTISVSARDTSLSLVFDQLGPLNLTEGAAPTELKINFRVAPVANATVTLTKTGSDDVTFSPNSLSFTTTDWETKQTVVITPGRDDDSIDDTATITFTAAAGATRAVYTVMVNVKDDTPAFVISERSLSLNEEGSSGSDSDTFDVKLIAVRPAAGDDVRVILTSSDTGVTLTPAALTFTNANWETDQTVTAKAIADGNTIDESVTITLDGEGARYEDVSGQVTVSVIDNDTAALAVDPTSLTINEGASGSIEVKLDTEPSGNVTVTLDSSNTDVVLDTNQAQSGRQNTLTFTMTNWMDEQDVYISVLHDDEAAAETATISMTADGAEYDDLTASATVTVDDDDSADIELSSLDSILEGESDTFMVSLATDPTANVTVSLAQSGTANSNVSFSPASLTFTSADWRTKQSVTVSAAEDEDSLAESATIKLTASGGGSGANSYASISKDVNVSVRDNDIPGMHFSSSTIEVLEEDVDGTSFDIRLVTRPSSDVTLTLTRSGSTDVSVDTDPDQTGNQNTLTFTSSNWGMNQTVTAYAADDSDSEADRATITFLAAGAEYDTLTEQVTINVRDNTVNLNFVPEDRNVSVQEDSFTNVTVVLSVQPEDEVSVDVEQRDPPNPDVRFFPTNLVFTSDNWNTPQTITVYADKDDDASDDTAMIDLETSGGGANYGTVSRTVMVRVPDPDTAALIFSPQSVEMIEAQSNTFTVRLATNPTAHVTVSVEQPSNAAVKAYTRAGNQTPPLRFSTSNWHQPQTVTVAADLDDDAFDDDLEITLKASGGGQGDDSYVLEEKIPVKVFDIDRPGLLLSPRRMEIEEGLDATFTVRLITEPSANVSVTLRQPTNPDIRLDIDPATPGNQNVLTFTPDNWDMPQQVTVSVGRDRNADNETVPLLVRASGGGYDAVEVRNVVVPVEIELPLTVIDKDEAGGLLTSLGALASGASGAITLNEGDERDFNVALDIQPTQDVRVVLTSDNPDVEFEPDTIIFTPSASTSSAISRPRTGTTKTSPWNAPVSVKLTIRHDDDPFLETAQVVMTASGGNYAHSTLVRHLNIADDEREDPGPGLVRPGDPLTWGARSYAFAIPPQVSNGDQAMVRLACKEQSEACEVYFDCTSQDDSRTYRGRWPRKIDPRGADTVTLSDIAAVFDDPLEKQGRLACIIRSEQRVVAQVWTRSGDGVLVNNSQLIRSRSNQADIGTIPSPRTGDISNIRIRCNKGGTDDCTDTRLECAEDDGTVHIGHLGVILRGIVRHVQTDELVDLLDHRWEGLGLSCTVLSDQPFTVQILTRTGGGGALVNNSSVSGG